MWVGFGFLSINGWCQIRNLRERLYEENQALRQREADNLILRRQLEELTRLLGRAHEKDYSSQGSSRDRSFTPECLQEPSHYDGIPISSCLPLHALLSLPQAHSKTRTVKRSSIMWSMPWQMYIHCDCIYVRQEAP